MQLICHHTYDTWEGLPVDRSVSGLSGGDAVGARYLADGIVPGSGALDLGTAPGHLIQVAPGPAWGKLGAVQVEMTVYLTGGPDLNSQQRTLLHVDDSFRFYAAQFYGLTPTGAPGFVHRLAVQVVDPDEDDGYVEVACIDAPFNRWGSVGFHYDGVHTLQLTVDGQVKARKVISAPLRPAGPGGVTIGGPVGPTGRNHPLAVDEVKVWRRDPARIHDVFVTRPLPPGAADCWARAFARIQEIWATDPQRAAEQQRYVEQLIDEIRRRIAASGDAAGHQSLHERYTGLWSGGRLDSDDMENVFVDLDQWWRDHGGVPWADGDILGTISIIDPPDGVDLGCDPELDRFLARLERAVRS